MDSGAATGRKKWNPHADPAAARNNDVTGGEVLWAGLAGQAQERRADGLGRTTATPAGGRGRLV
jgi:hypothetical protein